MWWSRKEASPEPAAAPPALPVTRAEWRSVPPIRPVLAEHPLVNPVQRFSSSLTSWRSPAYLEPLGHRVGPDEPAGVIGDLARPRTAETPTPAMPVVQRAARKRSGLSRLWGASGSASVQRDASSEFSAVSAQAEPPPVQPLPEESAPLPMPALVLPTVAPPEVARPLTSAGAAAVPVGPPVRTVQAISEPSVTPSTVDTPAAAELPLVEPESVSVGTVPVQAPEPAPAESSPAEPARPVLPVVQRTEQAAPRRLGLGAPILPDSGSVFPSPATPSVAEGAPLAGAVETTVLPSGQGPEPMPVAPDAPLPVSRLAEEVSEGTSSRSSPVNAFRPLDTPEIRSVAAEPPGTPGGSTTVSPPPATTAPTPPLPVARAVETPQPPATRALETPALPVARVVETAEPPVARAVGTPALPVARIVETAELPVARAVEVPQSPVARAVGTPAPPVAPTVEIQLPVARAIEEPAPTQGIENAPLPVVPTIEASPAPVVPSAEPSPSPVVRRVESSWLVPAVESSPLPVTRAVETPVARPVETPVLPVARAIEDSPLPVARAVEGSAALVTRAAEAPPLPVARTLDAPAPATPSRTAPSPVRHTESAPSPTLPVSRAMETSPAPTTLPVARVLDAPAIQRLEAASAPVAPVLSETLPPAPLPVARSVGSVESLEPQSNLPLPVARPAELATSSRPSTPDFLPMVPRTANGSTPQSEGLTLNLPPVVVSRQAEAPVIQRDPEPPAPEPAPPPAPPAPAVAAAPPAAPQPETEELVRKLFDPLLRRLKTELRLDRERRGALTDRPH